MVTVIAYLGVLAYLGVQIKSVINHENTQLTTMEFQNDLINNPFTDYYSINNIDFAMLLTAMDSTGTVD